VTRFQFVADHRNAFEVKRMCQLLDVHRSAFYAWDAAAPARTARTAADAELAGRIRAVHAEHRANRAYGAPRITDELNDGSPPEERVNHKRVARVMAEYKIAGIRLRRRVVTTVPEPADQLVPDLLEREFTAEAPNVKYVGDITYLPCGDGTHLYLATVIDCFSRRLVGWSIADHMRTELVSDALLAAAATRGTLAGAILHKGQHLGPVGGRIVVETLLGLLRADPQSYLSLNPEWTPTLPTRSDDPRQFDISDLLTYAVPQQVLRF
jgi:hypothetical protein